MNRILFVLAFILATNAPVFAANDDWHWVRVAPSVGPSWDVQQGVTTIKFDGSKFAATLKCDSIVKDATGNTSVWSLDCFSITGTIQGTQITATEVSLGTDAPPLAYQGTIQKIRTPLTAPSKGWGSDRITLNSGPWHIDLYRDGVLETDQKN